MANFPKTPKRSTGNFLKKLVAIAALSACGMAQAGLLDFEVAAPSDSPFIFTGEQHQFGDYWVESYGGTLGSDWVGTIVDGSDSGSCMIACPVNNTSHYYAGLDDGYFYFGLNDNSMFKVNSLQASFIGAGQAYAATSGLLVLQGFGANNVAIGSALQIGLAGPNAAGAFNFSGYDLSGTAFGHTSFSYVRVLGYACDATSNCNRNSDLANFAIDNIVTVPEPTTWALLGLGLIGMGVFSRKRSA